MGSILSAISDDYDDYFIFCGLLGIEPKSRYDRNSDFYTHQKEILYDLGFTSLPKFWESERKKIDREDKINDILK